MREKYEDRTSVVMEADGLRFFGILHKPLQKPPWPAVLLLHGFAGNKVGRTRQYVETSEVLALNGVAALRLDYRGCGDSEGNFQDMRMSAHIEDAMEGLRYLSEVPGVDATRIGVIGRSLGGPIAIQVAARSQQIKSMALWAPVSNSEKWRLEWETFSAFSGDDEFIYLNDLPFSRSFLAAFFREFFSEEPAKAMYDLGHIPLMHVHGELDTVVPIEHVHEYENYRKNAIAETRFLRLPECDHQFYHPLDQALLVKETHRWFHETL